MITVESFDGQRSYCLRSEELTLRVMALGATVTELCYRGRPVALRYPHAEDYLTHGAYLNAAVGRFANRIGGGSFMLDGQRYDLSRNENGNTLHGGADSWDRRVWDSRVEDDSVLFTLLSPDGDNGFPGKVRAGVRYRVCGGELRIDFEGETDRDTLFAPTTHLYFNLCGSGSVLDTRVRIAAGGYLETDAALIPTGRVLPAEGAFDFSAPRPIGRYYDHAFVLNDSVAFEAVAGGLRMTLETDFPALQFYTGEFLTAPHSAGEGFAVEPELYPDAPNHAAFPSAVLRAGERFHRYAAYRFSEER